MWQATSSPWAHQHTTALNFSYFKFSIKKYHRNFTPFFFFLPKQKSFSPKTNCSGWSTVVRKWKTHSGRHHPMPENKNPTLRNITSPLKNQNPLLLESVKSIVRLRFAVAGVLARWLVNGNPTRENTIPNRKMKTHSYKTLIHC